MTTSWTPERRKRQAQRIQQWQPWTQSTGPKSVEGKAAVARNAWKGGKRTLLRELAKEVREELREVKAIQDALNR